MARFSGDPDARALSSEARIAVMHQLLQAAKAWSALEDRYRAEGNDIKAEGAHRHGVWVMRALHAETDDPGVART